MTNRPKATPVPWLASLSVAELRALFQGVRSHKLRHSRRKRQSSIRPI